MPEEKREYKKRKSAMFETPWECKLCGAICFSNQGIGSHATRKHSELLGLQDDDTGFHIHLKTFIRANPALWMPKYQEKKEEEVSVETIHVQTEFGDLNNRISNPTPSMQSVGIDCPNCRTHINMVVVI
jgi:hypothetical protein